MHLAKNGWHSSWKQTHHINIWYYFLTDVNHHGGTQIQYCPTSNMVADFFTKPLLGPLFCKCCNEILNVDANAEITPALSEQEWVVTQQMLCHPDCPDLRW